MRGPRKRKALQNSACPSDLQISPRPSKKRKAFVPKLWLDCLPNEVCELIAGHVTKGKRTADAWNLALSSPHQLPAVLHSLRYSLTIAQQKESLRRPISDDNDNLWAIWMKRCIHTLHIKSISPIRSSTLQLLAAPTLQVVSIPTYLQMLRVLSLSTSIKELSFTFLSRLSLKIFEETKVPATVQRLTLKCGVSLDAGKCIFKLSTNLSSVHDFFVNAFENVLYLGAYCVCSNCDNSAWSLVKKFKRLRVVSTNMVPPEDMIPSLRSMSDIRFVDIPFSRFAEVGALGKSVTEVKCWSYGLCNANEACLLMKCVNLRALKLIVPKELDSWVCALLDTVKKVQELCVVWKESAFRLVPEIVEATELSPLAMVAASPRLKNIALKGVKFNPEELYKMTKLLGQRLESLELDITGWGWPMLNVVEKLLRHVLEHNHALKNLDIGNANLIKGKDRGEFHSLRELRKQVQRIRSLARRLEENGVNADNIRTCADRYFFTRTGLADISIRTIAPAATSIVSE